MPSPELERMLAYKQKKIDEHYARNAKEFEEVKNQVKENDRVIGASWDDFVNEALQQGQRQHTDNQTLEALEQELKVKRQKELESIDEIREEFYRLRNELRGWQS